MGKEQTWFKRQATESKPLTLAPIVMEVYHASPQSLFLRTLTSIFW